MLLPSRGGRAEVMITQDPCVSQETREIVSGAFICPDVCGENVVRTMQGMERDEEG